MKGIYIIMAIVMAESLSKSVVALPEYNENARAVEFSHPAPANDLSFGDVMDASGNLLAVSATGVDGNGVRGSVTVMQPVGGATVIPGAVFDSGYEVKAVVSNPSGSSDVGFGTGVAICEESGWLLVGAPTFGSTGTVYVYNANDNYTSHETLMPSNPVSVVGWSVDVDGDYAVIGDFGNGRGAMWVFKYSEGSGWVEVARSQLGTVETDHFGWSVAISGTDVIVGAPASSANAGKAVIYSIGSNGTSVDFVRELSAVSGSFFGWSVDIDNGVAVVGQTFTPVNARGAIYVYERNHGGDNLWGEIFDYSNGGASGAFLFFGESVAVKGNVIVVGEPEAAVKLDNGPNQNGAGRMTVFWRESDGWARVELVDAHDDAQTNAGFGSAVAITNSGVWAGAPEADFSGSETVGVVYGWALCGDGFESTGEDCDDGNFDEADGCANDCTLDAPVCGDGFVTTRVNETCEPSLDEDCRLAGDDYGCTKCGDGVIQPVEECDDGNSDDGDLCSSTCTEVDPGSGGDDGGDDGGVDGGDDGGSADGGSADGGSADGGSADGGSADGGSADGGSADGGSADGGSADGGSADGGSADGGSADGGSADAGGDGNGGDGAGEEGDEGEEEDDEEFRQPRPDSQTWLEEWWWLLVAGIGVMIVAFLVTLFLAGGPAPTGLRPLPAAYQRMLGHSDGFQLIPDTASP